MDGLAYIIMVSSMVWLGESGYIARVLTIPEI